MPTIKVFDPPMCCSSGVCGVEPDTVLAQFTSDLAWLSEQGVTVDRYLLSQQPDMFTSHEAVMSAISSGGTDALPIIMVGDQIMSQRVYPTRSQLAQFVGMSGDGPPPSSDGGCGCGPAGCC